jgi:hypothetical protein
MWVFYYRGMAMVQLRRFRLATAFPLTHHLDHSSWPIQPADGKNDANSSNTRIDATRDTCTIKQAMYREASLESRKTSYSEPGYSYVRVLLDDHIRLWHDDRNPAGMPDDHIRLWHDDRNPALLLGDVEERVRDLKERRHVVFRFTSTIVLSEQTPHHPVVEGQLNGMEVLQEPKEPVQLDRLVRDSDVSRPRIVIIADDGIGGEATIRSSLDLVLCGVVLQEVLNHELCECQLPYYW